MLLSPLALVAVALVAVTLVSPRPEPAMATPGNSITSPDTAGDVGQWTSLALDGSGNPVVSYYHETYDDLKLLHCDDVNCAGGGESITSPDTGGSVGKYTSLALDASGNPVVSYYDATYGDLKVVHCDDVNCAGGGESITSPDWGGDVGAYTSLALDPSGNPVVSYYDATNGNLKVMYCTDPNCAGDDEIITSPDTDGDVGQYTSLALVPFGPLGVPVVSYYDATEQDLKVLHCGDPFCASGNSITSPDTGDDVGQYTSLALDASGNPVVSYLDVTNWDLKVMHCNDPDCDSTVNGPESITSPDTGPWLGQYTSLALDASGNPVVSYFDFNNVGLKVLHCNDANCEGGDESISIPDRGGFPDARGGYTSLALDTSGNPVVSYYDYGHGDLKVLHCGDPNCTVEQPGGPVGGIAELPEADAAPLEAPDSSGGDAGFLAVVAATAAVAALTFGGAAWYARKRWLR